MKSYHVPKRLRRISLCLIIFLTALIIYVVVSQIFIKIAYYPYIESRQCRDQLAAIAQVLVNHAKDHGGYLPAEENWCSKLIEEEGISEKLLICLNSDSLIGQSDFMINKNLLGLRLIDIDPNCILLFEAKPSWNKAGGIEDVEIENHNSGINVVSVSGECWFSRTSEIQELKWNN